MEREMSIELDATPGAVKETKSWARKLGNSLARSGPFCQIRPMSTATLTLPIELDQVPESLRHSLVDLPEFAKSAEEWSRCVSNLSKWEDEHLLVDNPSPTLVAKHRKIVERLIFFGQLCA